jgi:phenylpyruvate tautomerase PptA (4-oxalocrotonate tautomerase family)
VQIQVLTNAGALDRGKQLAVVEQLTRIAAEAAGDPTLASRTWVLLTDAADGGWGLTATPTPMRSWWLPPGHRSPAFRPASPQLTSIATRTAAGRQLWISRYNGPANLGDAACCVAVSPVGTTVFVTGSACDLTTGIDYATVAYRV